MKTITTILLVLTVLCVQAQEKFSAGIQIEGIRSTPKNLFSPYAIMDKEFGAGAGVYFLANIWKSFSANTGLNYRTISYDCFQNNYTNYSSQISSVDSYTYKQNYLVVPVNLRKSFLNNWLFVEPGIELNWILGRENKKPKNEMLWKIGVGSKLGKLNYSLNYLWGNKEQHDMLVEGDKFAPVVYNSRMLQFKVSYPLWQKNK